MIEGCRIQRKGKPELVRQPFTMDRDDGPVRKTLNSRSFFAIFLSFVGGTAPNSASALMTRRLKQCGLSGGRSCSPHSLFRSGRIRFIQPLIQSNLSGACRTRPGQSRPFGKQHIFKFRLKKIMDSLKTRFWLYDERNRFSDLEM